MRVLAASLFASFAVAASAQTDQAEALFAAIARGDSDQVDRLLDAGVSPDAVDADGTPALMAAVLFADAGTVELLLDHDADPNLSDASGATPLLWAVPSLEKVRLLLDHGARVDARSATTDRTALLVAAGYPGTVELIRLLLERGADLHAIDRADSTALARAVRAADVEVVRFLVDRGLSLDALLPGQRRAGFARWDLPTTSFLMSAGPRLDPPDLLVTAATWQPPELVRRWIEQGADVTARDAGRYGRTPLLTAVASELQGPETLRILLEAGADPNVGMSEGETPLDWALYRQDRAKAQVLEEYGARRGTGPRQAPVAPPEPGGLGDLGVSVTSGVARVLEAAPAVKEQFRCISCHHNALPALAAATDASKGLDIDRALAERNLEDILTFFESRSDRMMLGDPAVGGEALTVGYSQLGLGKAGHPLDKITAVMSHWLMARQMPDGRWLGNGLNRPPQEYSIVSHTAIAAGGLRAYPVPGRADETAESLRRAGQWLLTAAAASAEERAMRLMGLVWTEAPPSDVLDAVEAVRVEQAESGGWSQFGGMEPDAYATGLSLYALRVAGVPPGDQTYRDGLAFLLGTQYQDGTWLVRTHSFPVQPAFESGFPFGRHQWISAAATSWATLAIAETLPDRAGAR